MMRQRWYTPETHFGAPRAPRWFRGEMDIIPPSEGGGAGSIPAGTAILASARRIVLRKHRENLEVVKAALVSEIVSKPSLETKAAFEQNLG